MRDTAAGTGRRGAALAALTLLVLALEVLERGDSPRIVTARLIGSGGRSKVRGDTLQLALGLYSSWARFDRRR